MQQGAAAVKTRAIGFPMYFRSTALQAKAMPVAWVVDGTVQLEAGVALVEPVPRALTMLAKH